MRRPTLLLGSLLAMTAPAATQVFVDADAKGTGTGASWANAFTDLRVALESASAGDQVWVAEGTYRPSDTGDRSATFLVPTSVALYGGFDGTESSLAQRAGLFETTILSGDLAGDDLPGFVNTDENSFHVVTNSSFVTTIDGLTIEGGNAVGSDGGGLYGPNLGGTFLQDVTFRDNQASFRGGGAYLFPGDSMVFRRCTFVGNRAGSKGGGFWTGFIDIGSTFESCLFVGNEARVSGGGLFSTSALVMNSAFLGNRADGGEGGGALAGGFLGLANCTLWSNTALGASLGGGGALAAGLDVTNTIAWGNRDDSGSGELAQLRPLPGAITSGRSNCIQGWAGLVTDGPGHVSGPPRFLAPRGADGLPGTLDDDLRLGLGSPCVDTGVDPLPFTYPATPLPEADLAGGPRQVDALAKDLGGVVDMGAWEQRVGDGTTKTCPQPPTSLGVPAALSPPTVFSLASGELRLRAGPVPASEGGFLLGTLAGPVVDGPCVAGATVHLLPAEGDGTSLTLVLDATALASLGVTAGSSWSVQAVFDDEGEQAASNAAWITVQE